MIKKIIKFLMIFFLLPIKCIWADGDFVDIGWLKLLHYQKNGNGYISTVENSEFFLSENGRVNPKDEYDASIKEFSVAGNQRKCDFPARFMYLKKEGKVSGDIRDCAEYQKFLDDVQPKAVTLLFTNAYMGNPSSLFGHTLFRIDTKRKGTQLLAHGANFGADTGDDKGIMYVLKGLWGGYFGTFGIKPYYDVINLYNNIENRDIWEYELNFDDDELNLFVAHIWEMKQAKIRYYFASKNCSYVLLEMLDAVKPELDVSSLFRFYTAPLQTLKVLADKSNLIKKANYRPSRQSKLKYRYRQMNGMQKDALIRFIKKNLADFSELNDDEKADVLETAYQYIQYRYVEGDLELADYRKKSFLLLRERSKIANQRLYFDELKDGENPLYSHKMREAGVSLGSRKGNVFEEIQFRPVYNSLLEDSYGLLKGAEIGFMDAKIRHYDNQNRYILQALNLLTIKSITGADDMFQPFSYDINVGYQQLFDAKKGQDVGAFQLQTGIGQGAKLSENLIAYIMSVPNGAYSGGLSDDGYLGFGVKGGVYYNLDKIRLHFRAMQNFTTSKAQYGQTYELEGTYGLTRNVMIYGGYKKFCSEFFNDEEVLTGIRFNF